MKDLLSPFSPHEWIQRLNTDPKFGSFSGEHVFEKVSNFFSENCDQKIPLRQTRTFNFFPSRYAMLSSLGR